jgi:hypothetical protein
MTLFSLPGGAHPIKVTALYGAIWYTDASGSFGRIDPGSATGTPVNPSASSTVTSSCTTLGLPTQLNGTPGTGALTWSSVDSTVTQPQAGLEVYSLPAGAAPLGIAADGNSIWLDDDGRNKMIRLDIENAPMLKLVKNVIKNNGGTAVAHDWTLTATGAGGFSDFGDSTTFHEVSAGVQYTLSESAVAGYQAGNWSCNGGTFAAPNKITLALDEDVTCTITNDDIAPTLKLVKVVINDNGGTSVAHNWTLTATGAGGFADYGDSTTFHGVTAGVQYTLSESTVAGYQAGSWSCSGGTFVSPNKITLALDADVTCTITNDDIGGGKEYHTYIPLVLKSLT